MSSFSCWILRLAHLLSLAGKEEEEDDEDHGES